MPAQGDSRILSAHPPDELKEDALNAFRDTRVLTEAALAIALAFVLGFVTVFRMPFGGSISLEMLPLILLALRQGPVVGIVAGGVYGLLNLIVSPFAVHPVQVLFDYPLAFAALGLAGFFLPTMRGAILGTVVAVLARLACHFISGVIFFASYAPEGWNPYLYSAAYNAAYLVPSLAIALVVVVLLLRALEGAQPSRRQIKARPRPVV
jgi:thiamine transporter